jgi:hypothetical protein
MQNLSFNDLIGLKRAWAARPGDGSGTVDCCLLAAEVHKRLGYYDYTDDLLAIIEENNYTDDTFPRIRMAEWLLENGVRLRSPEPHAVVLMPGNDGGAMGTVLDDGHTLYITGSSGVIRAPLPFSHGHHFRLNK